jgi:hypothetical protein
MLKLYNPDFDSKKSEKKAATLPNTGLVAFIFLQKYVGDTLFFTIG